MTGVAAAGTSGCSKEDSDGPWKLLCRYYAGNGKQAADSTAGKQEEPWSCVPRGANLKSLIATVPDPDTTHLSLYFDRDVETLMMAMGDANYGFDGYWLPWQVHPEQPFALLADRGCSAKAIAQKGKLPGLLLFRGPDGNTTAIWLVGEAPTSGMNMAQFETAVQVIRHVQGGSGAVPIGIIGPSFSGSLRPLGQELQRNAWLKPDQYKFQVVSGAATSYSEIAAFESLLKDTGSTYQSVIENDKSAADLFMQYAKEKWHGHFRVGILSEDETAYSAGITRPERTEAHDWTPFVYPRQISRLRNIYQEEAQASPAEQKGAPSQAPRPLFSLRDAAADAKEGRERDTVPAFSALQSPASQDATLESISAALRRERVDFIGIVATDVLDGVFLSRFLRENVPDTRLFTLDADLIFAAQADSPLDGMLSVTTYPLVSRNQHWTDWGSGEPPQRQRRLVFPSRYAQGTYNACRKLVHDMKMADGEDAGLIEYRRPGDRGAQTPALWLTVVGRDGYWPVALLDENRHDFDSKLTALKPTVNFTSPRQLIEAIDKFVKAYGQKAEPFESAEAVVHSAAAKRNYTGESGQIHPEPPGRGWFLCFWAIIILAAVHLSLVIYLLLHKDRQKIPDIISTIHQKLFWGYPDPKACLNEEERVFLMVISVCATSGLFVLSAPLARFGWLTFPEHLPAYVYLGTASLTVLSLWILAVWLGYGTVRKYWLLAVPTPLLGIGVFGVWYLLVSAPDYRTGEFFSYRCLNLSSGVAPNIPVLVLAGALLVWALTNLDRVGQTKKRDQAREVFDALSPVPPPLGGAEQIQGVDNAIEKLFSNNVWAPAIPFLLLWAMIFVPWRTFRSFESLRYDAIYIVLLGAVYWAIAVTWMHFIWCWSEFRTFLQWLERQAWRDSFSRLRKEIALVPLVSRPREHQLYVTSRSYDCLRAIASFDACDLDDKRESGLKALKGKLQTILGQINQDFGREDFNDVTEIHPEMYANLQGKMEAAAREIANDLTGWAWLEGASDSLQQEVDKRPEKAPLAGAEYLRIMEEEFIAYRYLLFIRYVLRHMRNLLGFIIWGFILSVISMSAYPFQGHRWIGLANTVTFVALAIGIVMVFAQMDRDAIMSRLTDTKAHELGKSFFIRLVQYGALPLATLLASQFPAVNRLLFSWVQPALEALK